MKKLTTIDDVLNELGGRQGVAELLGLRDPHPISNWRARGRLPKNTVFVMRSALEAKGRTAPLSLWGMHEPARRSA